MREAPVLPVTVECVSCSAISSTHHISYTTTIILAGQCTQCDDQARVMFLKQAYTYTRSHFNVNSISSNISLKKILLISALVRKKTDVESKGL